MTDVRYPLVSQSTENIENSRFYEFAASFGWGVLAGTIAMVLGLLAISGADIEPGQIITGLAFVGFFASLFTFAGMVAIGLPMTFALRHFELETAPLYAVLGMIGGGGALAIIFDFPRLFYPEAVVMVCAGAVAGLACGLRWGIWREQCAEARRQSNEKQPHPRRTNPIHDLIH